MIKIIIIIIIMIMIRIRITIINHNNNRKEKVEIPKINLTIVVDVMVISNIHHFEVIVKIFRGFPFCQACFKRGIFHRHPCLQFSFLKNGVL